MAISGGAKFFNASKCLSINGATAAATNGNSAAGYALDLNPYTYWYTVSSTDANTETYTITLTSAQSINRLFLLDHNWKQYTVKYLSSGVYVDFTNAVGLDGAMALGKISETAFADSSAYYEFDSVSTTSIQITVTKTQIANQDKYLAQVILTSEIGTMAGYPTIKNVTVDRNSKNKKTLSGKFSIQKGDETAQFTFQFKDYPSALVYNVDVDLMMTLHDLDVPFLVWLCGGRRGTTYFNYTLRGFRLKDVYQMQIDKALALSYSANVFKNPLNCEVEFQECIS